MEPFDIYILNTDFETVCLVEHFESFIWTDRYRGYGDFELYLPANSDALVYAIPDYYIWIKSSSRMMIIEKLEIITNVEDGNHFRITGRSLESILSRRIIWNRITLSGKVQTVVKKLITDAIISPSMSSRRISNFVFIDNNDSRLSGCEIDETQFLGENLYDTIIDILAVDDIGLKVVYNFEQSRFECSLYMGVDRSYYQTERPFYVFSPEFDNIVSSDYILTQESYKNVNLICGEDPDKESGKTKKFVYVNDGSEFTSGLYRREMYTDGSSNRQEYTDENEVEIKLTDTQYISVLTQVAIEELGKAENMVSKVFDAELSNYNMTYGEDYEIGDIVQAINEYNMSTAVRITEMIISQDTSAIQLYPTFEVIKDDE